MATLETDIRREVGGVLSEEEIQELLPIASENLERAVGVVLSAGLSDDDLEEFEALADVGDEAGTSRWLEQGRPDYREVVAAQVAALLERLEALRG